MKKSKLIEQLSMSSWANRTESDLKRCHICLISYLLTGKNKVKIEHSDIMYYPGTRCQIICSSILKVKMQCDVKGNLSVSIPISAGANRDTLSNKTPGLRQC